LEPKTKAIIYETIELEQYSYMTHALPPTERFKRYLAHIPNDSELKILIEPQVREHLFVFSTNSNNEVSYGLQIFEHTTTNGTIERLIFVINGNRIEPYVFILDANTQTVRAKYLVNECIDEKCAYLLDEDHILYGMTEEELDTKIQDALQTLYGATSFQS
jgi:hypothetical protein